jgi:hypothetical protein
LDTSSCLILDDLCINEIIFIKCLLNVGVEDRSAIGNVTEERESYIFRRLRDAGFLITRIENTQMKRASTSVAITKLDNWDQPFALC